MKTHIFVAIELETNLSSLECTISAKVVFSLLTIM